MNHDHRSFAAARAYQGGTADRIRRFLPMVQAPFLQTRLSWPPGPFRLRTENAH